MIKGPDRAFLIYPQVVEQELDEQPEHPHRFDAVFEIFFLTSVLLHCGHSGFLSEDMGTSFSNSLPQCLHWYS